MLQVLRRVLRNTNRHGTPAAARSPPTRDAFFAIQWRNRCLRHRFGGGGEQRRVAHLLRWRDRSRRRHASTPSTRASSAAPGVWPPRSRKHGRAQHRVRVVDVVYNEDDAKALETHLMIKHDTLFKNADKMRQLLAHENREFDHLHPDISLDGKPRSFQLNQNGRLRTKSRSTRRAKATTRGRQVER